MKNVFLSLSILIFLLSCSEESTEQEVPQVESNEEQVEQDNEEAEDFELSNFSLKIEVFEEGGILLEATATEFNDQEISDYGFLLSLLESPNFDNSQKFEPQEIVENKFSQTVDKDLDFNKEYFVIAYVKVGNEYEYTPIKSFVSTGSKAPVISLINQAHIGDTLQIKGSNFTSISNRIKVLFDEEIGTVLESSDTLITCIVPTSLTRFNPKVAVELYQKQGAFEEFSLFKPIIENISKTSVSIGDTLTVYGQHFDFKNSRNVITVEEKQGEVLFSSRDSITFVLPKSLSFSNNSFALNSQLQEVESQISFTIVPPQFSSVPESFRAYEEIEILGNNFSPIPDDNKVFFDNNLAKVLEASQNRLKIRVPIGEYEDWNPSLSLQLMDYSITYVEQITLSDTWLMVKRPPSYYWPGRYFIHNNIAYLFVEDDTYARFEVLRFDSDLNQLSSFYVDYPRTTIKDENFKVLYNELEERVFFYFSEEEENNFYEFDLATTSFEVRTNYPDNKENGNAIFSIADKLYMGFGRFTNGVDVSENPQPYAQFWEYDLANDTWNQRANFPIDYRGKSDTSNFVINGEGYVANGATSTGDYDFWKYNPTTDEWIRLDNFPDHINSTAYFEYDSKGYVIFGGFTSNTDTVYYYDIILDDWIQKEDVNDLYYLYNARNESAFALKFSNSIYIGSRNYSDYEIFKANLNKL